MNTTELMAAALDALTLIEGADVRVRGQPLPTGSDRLIVMDLVTSRRIGDMTSTGREVVLQVNAHAPTTEDALALAEEARDALSAAGWHEAGPERRLPSADEDTLSGITQDYTR